MKQDGGTATNKLKLKWDYQDIRGKEDWKQFGEEFNSKYYESNRMIWNKIKSLKGKKGRHILALKNDLGH